LLIVLLLAALAAPVLSVAQAQDSASCVNCHRLETPGIVTQWQGSKKASAGVGCVACHGADHQSAADYRKAQHPNPDTCQKCHPRKVERYRAGKHSLGWAAMLNLPTVTHLPQPGAEQAGFRACAACHKIGEKSPEELRSPLVRYGTGSCDSCHTRHTFSAAEARDPRACQTCHMGFGHAQWEMWSTSKHGTIWGVEGDSGRAPTCQTCHMRDGDHAVLAAWGNLGLRLPESDQAWQRDRSELLRALGVLDSKGQHAAQWETFEKLRALRLTEGEWLAERTRSAAICSRCHATDLVVERLEAGDDLIRQADAIMADAIRTVTGLYTDKSLPTPPGWTGMLDLLQFADARSGIERELYRMFAESRMQVFKGAFHSNPDYTHRLGLAAMHDSQQMIKVEAAALRSQAAARAAQEAAQKEAAALRVKIDIMEKASNPADAIHRAVGPLQAQIDRLATLLAEAQDETAALETRIAALQGVRPVAASAVLLAVLAVALAGLALFGRRPRG
jgi:hypothetical protein